MKRFLMFGLGLLMMLTLAACASSEPAAEIAAEPTASIAPIPTVDAAEVDANDLTLVGNTGRPQFLNAFATW